MAPVRLALFLPAFDDQLISHTTIRDALMKLLARLTMIGILTFFTGWAHAAPPQLKGQSVQGGLMWGQVEREAQITLDSEPITVHADGTFVFGFGRDETGERVLTVSMPDGTSEHVTIQIQERTFDIERVDGLPPKTVSPPPEWTARRKVENGRVKSARSVLTPAVHWTAGFLKPSEGRFSGFYGSQRVLNGEPRSPHYGLDIAADTGTPIIAPAAGIVRLAAPDFLLEGGIVIIDHGLGITSTLFHMSRVDVTEGQSVEQGDLIGAVGAAGRANGPHVDWRVNWKNVRLDPMLLLEGEQK